MAKIEFELNLTSVGDYIYSYLEIFVNYLVKNKNGGISPEVYFANLGFSIILPFLNLEFFSPSVENSGF